MRTATSPRQPARDRATIARRPAADRDQLTGTAVVAGFGAIWACWAATALTGSAGPAVAAVGLLAGAAIVAHTMRQRRLAPPAERSLFSSRAVRVTTTVEMAAIGAGLALLHLTDAQRFTAQWVAIVVGAHFLAFGRLIHRRYYLLGALTTAAGLACTAAVAAGSGTAAAQTATELAAASCLLLAASSRSLRSRGRPDVGGGAEEATYEHSGRDQRADQRARLGA